MTYCFYDTVYSLETLFFVEFILYLEHRAEGSHSEDSFLMKCGGEGCLEEVFDGGA